MLSQLQSNTATNLPATLPQSVIAAANLLPAPVSPELARKWALIPAKQFLPEKAAQCVRVAEYGEWQEYNPVKYGDAILSGAPTIGALTHYLGNKGAVHCVAQMLAWANALLNVGKGMRNEQLQPTAHLLVEENRLLNVADFRLALKKAVKGDYGTTYDRLDVQVIQTWLNQYWNDRLEAAEHHRLATYKAEKKAQEANAVPMPESVKELAKSLAVKPEPPKDFEPDEILLKVWRVEFEAIENKDEHLTFENFKKLKIAQLK